MGAIEKEISVPGYVNVPLPLFTGFILRISEAKGLLYQVWLCIISRIIQLHTRHF